MTSDHLKVPWNHIITIGTTSVYIVVSMVKLWSNYGRTMVELVVFFLSTGPCLFVCHDKRIGEGKQGLTNGVSQFHSARIEALKAGVGSTRRLEAC